MTIRRFLSPAFLLSIVFLPAFHSSLFAQAAAQPDETLPGIKPTEIFDGGPVDHVGVYGGDTGIVVPLGPEYRLGPSFSWQLKAYNTINFWHTYDEQCSGNEIIRSLVRGTPTIGAGWWLNMGYVGAPAFGLSTWGTIGPTVYVSPDGAQHLTDASGVTLDNSRLKVSLSGGVGTVKFPDGIVETFAHLMPKPQPTGSTSVDMDWGDVAPAYGLTTIVDSFGTTVLTVQYSAANPWEITSITLLPNSANKQILFTWHSPTGGGWDRVTSLQFPLIGPSSTNENVRFTYAYGDDGAVSINRGGADTTENTDGTSPCYCQTASPTTTAVPILTKISLYNGPTTGTSVADYSMCYTYTGSPCASGANNGMLASITIPTGATITYGFGLHGSEYACNTWPPANLESTDTPNLGNGPVESPDTRCPPSCVSCIMLGASSAITSRTVTDPVTGVNSTTTYTRTNYMPADPLQNSSGHRTRIVEVVESSDGSNSRITRYLFHNPDKTGDPADIVGGIELEHSVSTGTTFTDVPVRTIVNCYDLGTPGTGTQACGYLDDTGVPISFTSGSQHPVGSVTWYGSKPSSLSGGTCTGSTPPCVSSLSTISTWDAAALKYKTSRTFSSGLATSVDRSTVIVPETNTAGGVWLLDPVQERSTYDGAAPTDPNKSDGITVVRSWFETELSSPASGYVKGSLTWDSPTHTLLLGCRYRDAAGGLQHDLSLTDADFSTPPNDPCATYMPDWSHLLNSGSIGLNNDYFGHDASSQNGQILTYQWVTGGSTPVDLPWKAFSVARDTTTGLITTSNATDSKTTTYTYDSLGRITKIAPPGTETATFVCHDSPTQTTVYRATSQLTCPVSGGASTLTWHQYQYDGQGRLIREYRLQPDLTLVKRFTKYDVAGNAYFHSEWVTSATSETVTANTSKTVNGCTESVPSGAAGTFLFCYDPFGRAQGSVGPKFSGYVTTTRADGTISYSDTSQSTTVACVGGTWSGTTCTGGTSAVTTTQRDAFGRVTKVTEPSNDVTTYSYNVQDKLTSVAQGTQSRSFTSNAFAFLTAETSPEQGTVSYGSYGSLGNLREKVEGAGTNHIDSTYEPAGRLSKTCAGSASDLSCATSPGYVSNSYDAGCTSGTQPGCGRLTQSVGSNYVLDPGPSVTEGFTYSTTDGRLSSKTTTVGSDYDPNDGAGVRDGESIVASESWTYSNLGLVLSHNLPRTSGTYSIGYGYGTDLPTTVTAAGVNKASSVLYNPAGALKQWVSGGGGISGGNVTTAIAFDSSIPSRPTSITTSNASPNFVSGTYTYDGAGNIMAIGADTFAYDNRSRVTSASYSSGAGSQTFTYDRYGNLTNIAGTNPRTLTTSTTTNQLTGQTYDTRGNMTSQAGYNGFDGLDRITNIFPWYYLSSASAERVAKFPDNNILRREMAKLIVQARGEAKSTTACNGAVDVYFYADVACSDPDRSWIDKIHEDGIANGYGNGVYGPQNSLTRGEMSVFLALGKLAPNSVPISGTVNGVPYNCVSGGSSYFSDVLPTDIFCPSINYIASIGITFGCGTDGNGKPIYCPTSTVPESQMMAFTRRGWPSFFYVPRGTIYTFRDGGDRISTEMMSKPGSTSYPTNDFPVATAVTRDNLFLGNLLVASNAGASGLGGTPGWSYYFSDHLGTPRLIAGAETGTPKYWPYGDEVSGTPITSERLKFATMERDVESTHFNDHARHHAYDLGRFVSVDRHGGRTGDPQTWNRYAYSRDNPIRYVDPNGQDIFDIITGAANAFGSDFTNGAGRNPGGNSDFRSGQALGDVAAAVGGAIEAVVGLGGEVGGLSLDATGAGAAIGVPAGVVSTGAIVQGGTAIHSAIVHLSESKGSGGQNASGGAAEDAPAVKDLKRLSDKQIKNLGGEEATREIKAQTGGSKANLYWNPATGKVYSVPRNGGVPEHVYDLPPKY